MAGTFFTQAGMAITANRVNGAGTAPLNMGWGTGAGAASAASTTLSTEVDTAGAGGSSRTAGTASVVTTTVTNDTYQVIATRTATGGPFTVTNLGTFDATSGGNLYMIVDAQSVLLSSGDAIQGTWKLKYS